MEAVNKAANTVTDAAANAYNDVEAALSTAPPSDQYLAWNATGVEHVKHAYRATHVKTQGIVKGTLTVLPNLPAHLQQGLFKTPGRSYDVAARYSSEPVFLQADQEPGPRGLGLRIFGIEGERLPSADQEALTQDLFFNNAPMIELTDIETCLEIMQLRENAPFMLPNTNMISHSFYTQSAFRFGQWYGHIGLFPVNDEMTSKKEKVKSGDSRERLREWLAEYFREHGAKYELKTQLGTDPSHHPTEDGSVVWDEATAPYQTIATVEFPPQDALSDERRTFWEDKMKLNPWNALAEHQLLGSINRLREIVYEMSRKKREQTNAVPTKMVNSVDEIP
ncbi:hypothetical protein INS49_002261 [Diaporthe citri]|uniref:uncharacterized protein n=1 Tax=Diaporthe citri TaxID=83186 RepID=UPI001C7FD3A2|nr:uncharacterized protein INS49_002261 [Diaporthe citri]KAG6368061.1 hypothetical protein INS49_002261 [Diaporthe citri]